MKKCAVIVSAYDCAEYIGEMLFSFRNQRPLDGWEYELRLGIDGCKKTMKADGLPNHWYTDENYGAYIMRNSLIALGDADVYSYFDADDVMEPTYLKESLQCVMDGHDVVMTAKTQFDNSGQVSDQCCVQAGGALTFTREALYAVGGYQKYRVAGDTDFMARLEMAGYPTYLWNQPLYRRRKHGRSLTTAPMFGMESTYRRDVWNLMSDDRRAGKIKLHPVCVELKERDISRPSRWW